MPHSGIYIHVPFCRDKCDYCSFYSVPLKEGPVLPVFTSRIMEEMESMLSCREMIPVDTIYFGGGTPSILGPGLVAKIIGSISEHFDIQPGSEITLEMNPDDLSEENLAGFSDTGVNRIVLGIQSLNPDMRKSIGRRGRYPSEKELDLFFTSDNFIRCVDIICGLPGQNEPILIEDLRRITSYRPEHISLYLLSVDESTPLSKRFSPDDVFDDLQADLWGSAMEFLAAERYIQYEISNFSLPGYESRHNTKYWEFTDYFGFGPGSHSFVEGGRYFCANTVDEYLNGEKFFYEKDIRDGDGLIVEFLMTSIRRMKGFSPVEFREVTGLEVPAGIINKLGLLSEKGLVEHVNGRFRLTRDGIFHADSVIYTLAEDYIKPL